MQRNPLTMRGAESSAFQLNDLPVKMDQGLPPDTTRNIMIQALEDMRDPMMQSLVRYLVRNLAPPNKYPITGRLSEIAAVDQFVQQYIRYTRDPVGMELVHTPKTMLERIKQFGRWSEDCESIAGLTITMLMSLGHRCRLAMVGFPQKVLLPGQARPFLLCRDGRYSHIFVESKIPRAGWLHVDPTTKDLDQSKAMGRRICTFHYFYPESLEK